MLYYVQTDGFLEPEVAAMSCRGSPSLPTQPQWPPVAWQGNGKFVPGARHCILAHIILNPYIVFQSALDYVIHLVVSYSSPRCSAMQAHFGVGQLTAGFSWVQLGSADLDRTL